MEAKMNIKGGEAYVSSQLRKHLSLLHDLDAQDIKVLNDLLPSVLQKVRACWSGIRNKYYCSDNGPVLDINNSNQYCQFLLYLAREANLSGQSNLADRVFGLNKMLNSCDIYHAVPMPDCFYMDHTLGTVIGRAKIGNYFFVSQGCTIGGNPGMTIYPEIGHHNYLMSNVTLIGKVKTGARIIYATGCLVKDMDIPSDSIVFGRTPHNVIKPLSPEKLHQASPFILG